MNINPSGLKLVNRGSNSEIYRYGNCQSSVILKLVSSVHTKECRHLENQFNILTQIDHENIIKVLRYKANVMLKGSPNSKQFQKTKNILVLENAIHGSLLQWFQKANPTYPHIRWIASEISQGLRFLHCNYIVHRDLKLENVLVTQNSSQIQIKIADFGFATRLSEAQTSNSHIGTRRAYMAPQIHLAFKDPSQEYDPFKADIFALGVIFFCLVFGKLPFEYATIENSHYNPIYQNRVQDFWKQHYQQVMAASKKQQFLVEDFKELFFSMVCQNPSKRPTIQQVLESSWLKGHQEIFTVDKTKEN